MIEVGRGGRGTATVHSTSDTVSVPVSVANSSQSPPPSTKRSIAPVSSTVVLPVASTPVVATARATLLVSEAISHTRPRPAARSVTRTSGTAVQRCQ